MKDNLSVDKIKILGLLVVMEILWILKLRKDFI